MPARMKRPRSAPPARPRGTWPLPQPPRPRPTAAQGHRACRLARAARSWPRVGVLARRPSGRVGGCRFAGARLAGSGGRPPGKGHRDQPEDEIAPERPRGPAGRPVDQKQIEGGRGGEAHGAVDVAHAADQTLGEPAVLAWIGHVVSLRGLRIGADGTHKTRTWRLGGTRRRQGVRRPDNSTIRQEVPDGIPPSRRASRLALKWSAAPSNMAPFEKREETHP